MTESHPMEQAIWWLEYLSATKGANHLKLSSRHLNVFQYFSLDFIILIFIVFHISFRLSKIIYDTDIVQKLQFCFYIIAFSGQLFFLYLAYFFFIFWKYIFSTLVCKIPFCKNFTNILQVPLSSKLLCKMQNSGLIQQWKQYNIASTAFWVIIIAMLVHYAKEISCYFS